MGRACEPGWELSGPTYGIATNPHWFVWGKCEARLGAVATDQAPSSPGLGHARGPVELG